jgi:hypothetical protein
MALDLLLAMALDLLLAMALSAVSDGVVCC